MPKKRMDYDSPWKETIGRYFEPFLAFFYPAIHAEVDWTQGYQLLDKELQKIVRDANLGRREADLLVRVMRKSGQEAWVLVHVEVQSQVDSEFPSRMWVYHYRIYDRYQRQVVSLAILGDDNPNWRPDRFELNLWGCQTLLVFPTVKLLDYFQQDLVPSSNPLAWVVAAHLGTLGTQPNSPRRLNSKIGLSQGLYGCGLNKDEILELLRLIDWIMLLSPELDALYSNEMTHYEEEMKMAYRTTFERHGHKKGLEQGLEQGREQGREEGRLQAWEECRVQSLQESVLRVLRARAGSA